MDSQTKGLLYEIQIRDHIINKLNKPAYLWSEIPETLLLEHNIIGSHNEARIKRKSNKDNPLIDTGVDVIQIDDDKLSFVQCKNGYKKGVTMEDLAGFSIMTLTYQNFINKGYVYYTNKLSPNILSLPQNDIIEFIKEPFLEPTKENIINNYEPFYYQLEALDAFTKWYAINDRGILSLPCGTGKTYTSYLISKAYKQVIIISPLKQFAKQNLDRYIDYGYNINNTLLVDSDGTRDKKEIKKFIKSNESFLISATYCSVDMIKSCLKYMKDPFIIVDEFHNLSKNNVMPYLDNNDDNEDDEKEKEENNDDFYQLLSSNNKFLFMSATPRIYELEDDGDALNDDLMGSIVYNMSFTDAINNKLITDYQIWLPSIHENNDDLKNELSIYNIDSTIKAKCMFFFSCLLNNGSQKTIIYCKDTEEINIMINAMKKLDEFFLLDCQMTLITAKTSYNNRTKILNDFENNNKRQLLFSVRILDECIDIPKCDSIFITYPTKSKIRTIQRMSRAIRLDKNNKFKIANIFIWCDEYSEILDTLSGIKEYDLLFKDKIKVNEISFTNNGNQRIDINNDKQLISNYLVGIKPFKIMSWTDKLNEVKKYIDANKKSPSKSDKKIDVKQLGMWICNQKTNYDSDIKKCKKGMKNKEIYNLWTAFINDDKYKQYFESNENIWKNKLNQVKQYIDENNKLPSTHDKNGDIKQLGEWISRQKTNYDSDIKKCKEGIKNKEIYDLWTAFINDDKYKEFFESNENIWINKLEQVKQYIDENNKLPSKHDKNNDIKQLGRWISTQKTNYDVDIKKCKQGMKNKEIYDLWTAFINDDKYKEYFESS